MDLSGTNHATPLYFLCTSRQETLSTDQFDFSEASVLLYVTFFQINKGNKV